MTFGYALDEVSQIPQGQFRIQVPHVLEGERFVPKWLRLAIVSVLEGEDDPPGFFGDLCCEGFFTDAPALAFTANVQDNGASCTFEIPVEDKISLLPCFGRKIVEVIQNLSKPILILAHKGLRRLAENLSSLKLPAAAHTHEHNQCQNFPMHFK